MEIQAGPSRTEALRNPEASWLPKSPRLTIRLTVSDQDHAISAHVLFLLVVINSMTVLKFTSKYFNSDVEI